MKQSKTDTQSHDWLVKWNLKNDVIVDIVKQRQLDETAKIVTKNKHDVSLHAAEERQLNIHF